MSVRILITIPSKPMEISSNSTIMAVMKLIIITPPGLSLHRLYVASLSIEGVIV